MISVELISVSLAFFFDSAKRRFDVPPCEAFFLPLAASKAGGFGENAL